MPITVALYLDEEWEVYFKGSGLFTGRMPVCLILCLEQSTLYWLQTYVCKWGLKPIRIVTKP
jgi:hypothetical protein